MTSCCASVWLRRPAAAKHSLPLIRSCCSFGLLCTLSRGSFLCRYHRWYELSLLRRRRRYDDGVERVVCWAQIVSMPRCHPPAAMACRGKSQLGFVSQTWLLCSVHDMFWEHLSAHVGPVRGCSWIGRHSAVRKLPVVRLSAYISWSMIHDSMINGPKYLI